MKASEFRINNLLQDSNTGSLLIVSELSNNTIIYSVLDRDKYPLPNGWKAEPIPITEEWLERFGFERKEGRWTWIKIIYNEETTLPTTLQLWSGNDYVSVCRAGIGAMDCPCEHVHQLQNLYFALTGQELSVT